MRSLARLTLAAGIVLVVAGVLFVANAALGWFGFALDPDVGQLLGEARWAQAPAGLALVLGGGLLVALSRAALGPEAAERAVRDFDVRVHQVRGGLSLLLGAAALLLGTGLAARTAHTGELAVALLLGALMLGGSLLALWPKGSPLPPWVAWPLVLGFAGVNASSAARAALGIARADTGWEPLGSGPTWDSPLVLLTSREALFATTQGEEKSSHASRDGGRSWDSLHLPGHPGTSLVEDAAGGRIWMAPSDGDALTFFDEARRGWYQVALPKQGFLRGLAVDERQVLAAYPDGLYRSPRDSDGWTASPEIARCSTLAAFRDRRLVVGSRWLLSEDGGERWRELDRRGVPDFAARAALGPTRAYILVHGGPMSDAWFVTVDGEHTQVEAAPCTTGSAVNVNPEREEELVIGCSGEGVLHSTDGGRSWRSLGFFGAQVESLAVDYEQRWVYAGAHALLGANGLFRRRL
ncbi:hypothetical protein WMF28_10965 [Sorangium sp. So ce590]|uniref:WD40/YVTN/BNR-like repeat-containing protein n=1 Tax=Sorangium sp. So ce590 TaxID=3133317 RepID=UPI003F61E1E5